jgi:hypothetical protein
MGRRAAVNAKKRNRRIVTISIVVAIIAVVVVLALIVEASQSDPNSSFIGKPVSAAILQQVTGVSNSTLAAVGLPASVTPPAAITGSALTSGGKPEVVYVGGEFCPFCAVERWSMIVALSHFGSFTGIEYMQSSSTDTNANTPTFTFAGNATSPFNFTSKYITFLAIEEFDRSENVRQPLNTTEQALVTQYDTCATTGTADGIPFIDIANAYVVNCGAQFSLPQIAGDNWTQVSSQLNTAGSPIAQGIDGAANTLITAICKVDGEQPASLCIQSFATVTLAYATPASSGGQQSLAMLPQVREESRWTS